MIRQGSLFLAAGLLLSACTLTPGRSPTPPVTAARQAAHCGDNLAFYDRLAAASAEQRLRAEQLLRDDLERRPRSCDQLRLGLLLSIPLGKEDREQEARDLFNRLLNDSLRLADSDRLLARLLLDQLDSRRQLRQRLEASEQRFSDEHKALIRQLKRLESTRKRLQQLETQIEQLKAIEENINQREQEVSTPATDRIPHETE